VRVVDAPEKGNNNTRAPQQLSGDNARAVMA